VEEGRHEMLFSAGGRYWSLLNRQRLEDAIEDMPETLAQDAVSQ
jgi:hypothetical protein